MSGNSYDRGALEETLHGMSKRELRRFWWDLVSFHATPYPRYLRTILEATSVEYAQRLREEYCPVTKLHKAITPRRPANAN